MRAWWRAGSVAHSSRMPAGSGASAVEPMEGTGGSVPAEPAGLRDRGDGPDRSDRGDTGPASVALVVEQLRRRVPGGIGTYCTGLLQGLSALRAEGAAVPPLVAVASRPPAHPDPLAGAGVPLRVSSLPGPALTRAWDLGMLPVRGVDVVHATSMAAPPAGRARLAVTVHDLAWRAVPDAYPPRGRRWHEAALARVRRRAGRVVVPAREVADDLVADGVPAERVEVIEHGCDHLPPPDGQAADDLLAGLGVRGPFLLAVGTLEPRKNLERLVAAHRLAAPDLGGPMPLVVVGPRGWGTGGPPVDGSTDGAAPSVVATGPVNGAVLAALYERARLLAYVPLVEGYGLPPVEAMRAGTPVVSSPLPSTGGASLVVDPTDVVAMAGALRVVATDERCRQELIEAGRVRSARRWRDSAADHLALWGAAW